MTVTYKIHDVVPFFVEIPMVVQVRPMSVIIEQHEKKHIVELRLGLTHTSIELKDKFMDVANSVLTHIHNFKRLSTQDIAVLLRDRCIAAGVNEGTLRVVTSEYGFKNYRCSLSEGGEVKRDSRSYMPITRDMINLLNNTP